MGSAEPELETTFETAYGDVMEWVDNYFVQVFGDSVGYRPGDQLNWCPEWWRHSSAVIRLDALWRVWERYRHDGGPGISAWFLDHADPHMRVLIDVNGPFRRCSVERGHRGTSPLPSWAPERSMFDGPAVDPLWRRTGAAAPDDTQRS